LKLIPNFDSMVSKNPISNYQLETR
jgi:hypothetical protein